MTWEEEEEEEKRKILLFLKHTGDNVNFFCVLRVTDCSVSPTTPTLGRKCCA